MTTIPLREAHPTVTRLFQLAAELRKIGDVLFEHGYDTSLRNDAITAAMAAEKAARNLEACITRRGVG